MWDEGGHGGRASNGVGVGHLFQLKERESIKSRSSHWNNNRTHSFVVTCLFLIGPSHLATPAASTSHQFLSLISL